MNDDCLFCKIAAGDIPANKVYEDDEIVAFEDINPQAPVHILLIPRTHVENIDAVTEEHQHLLGKMLLVARDLAREKNIADDGYRLVFNTNRNAGQEVFHIHLHLLGGRTFSWPPG